MEEITTREVVLAKLLEMVKEYYKYDTAEKAAKKSKELLNKEMKKMMRSADLEEFETEELIATFSIQERSSMNEVKLVAKLKELGFTDAIETVEKPNAGVLETLIYDGKLDPALIADCEITKEVEVLSVKKKKGGKK